MATSDEKQNLDAPPAPTATASNTSDSDVEILSGNVDEKKLLRKLDLRLLPAVSILYLLSFLDRSNGMSFRSLPAPHPNPSSPDPTTTIPIHSLITRYSRKRPHRRPNNRPPHDRQPIPHRPNAVLHRLRALRDSMQHHLEANESEILAPDADGRVGRCGDVDGRDAESGGVFYCAIFVSIENPTWWEWK